MNDPKNLSTLLTAFAWEIVERKTKNTQATYSEIFRARRQRGLGGNKLTSKRLFTQFEFEDVCWYYGICLSADVDLAVVAMEVEMSYAGTVDEERTPFERRAERADSGWTSPFRDHAPPRTVRRFKFRERFLNEIEKDNVVANAAIASYLVC